MPSDRGRRTCRCPCNYNCHGNYLVVVYLFVKLLYLVNIAAQLLLLDMFLGTPFHAYGFEVRVRASCVGPLYWYRRNSEAVEVELQFQLVALYFVLDLF